MSGYSNSTYSAGHEEEAPRIGQGKKVALDFDGTLHPYTAGWTGSVPENEPPVPGALGFVKGLLRDGYNIDIFSCRADHEEGRVGIEQWLAKWFGVEVAQWLQVTHEKPGAVAYVDDRAVEFSQETLNWDACRARVDALARSRGGNAAVVSEAQVVVPLGYLYAIDSITSLIMHREPTGLTAETLNELADVWSMARGLISRAESKS